MLIESFVVKAFSTWSLSDIGMSQTTKDVRFDQLLARPTSKQFRQIQNQVLADRDYDPWSSDLRELDNQFQAGEYEQILHLAPELFPIWQLSPNFHFLVGNAALELGESEIVIREKLASRVCLQQLLDSGEGTATNPYCITYIRDEIDIAMAQGCDIRCRQLVHTRRGRQDVLTSHEGIDLWFDVEPLFQKNCRTDRRSSEETHSRLLG